MRSRSSDPDRGRPRGGDRCRSGPFWAVAGLLAVLLAVPVGLAAQEGTVAGVVRDAQSDRPLDAVQVFVPGTGIGVLTNAQGRFVLVNVPAGEHTVRAELLGHAPQEETVTVRQGQSVELDITLSQRAIELDQVVVTGAGRATERRKLGNTVASVNVEGLEAAPTNNVSELLQGREAGVSLNTTGGMAGEGSTVRIRGSSSLTQNNTPIIYLDGVRIDNSVSEGDAGGASRLDDINPEAIERVEILKGAAAATLYGTEASNGVIQIFTKQGQAGDPQWEMSVEGGLSQQDMSRYAPGAGFACSVAAQGLLGNGCTQELADQLSEYWGLGRSIGPYDVFEVPLIDPLFETGHHQSYSLSVRGGSENINYFVSGRYGKEDGAYGGNQFGPAQDIDTQKQATANLTFYPTSDLRLRFNSNYMERFHEVPTNGNNTTGTFSMTIMSKPELAHAGNSLGACCFATIREMYNIEQFEEAQRFAGSFHANYTPIQDLSLDAIFGVDMVNSQEIDFSPFGWDVDGVSAYAPQGERASDDRNRREITVDLKAGWDHQLNESFSSSLNVGTQLLLSKIKEVGSYGYSFPGPGLSVTEAASEQSVSEFIRESVNAGAFVQEQVGYGDYLFTTVGARFDRHSAFGEETGTAFYPKLSVSFVPSSMQGWGGLGPVSSLRLRSAIGQSGLQPGAFDKFTTFAPAPSSEGPGVSPDNLGNPDLRPEVSTEWEVGGEAGLFDDRFSIEATYWDRTVDDALVDRQFSPSGGFTDPQLYNLGELTGRGVDLALNGNVFSSPGFSIDAFANASYLQEEVTDLGGAPALKIGYYRYRTWIVEGYAPGAFFSKRALTRDMVGAEDVPFDQDGDGEPDSRADMLDFLSGPVTPEDLQLVQYDGGGPAGEHYRGKPTPDWSGSFGLDFEFLNDFRLSSMFEYAFGNFYHQNLSGGFRASHAALGRNTPETVQIEATLMNPASTPEERLEAAEKWPETVSLSPWSGMNHIEEADYLRWREISLTYRVPSAFIDRFGADRVSLTAGARNLQLWTKYGGIDPENNVITDTSSTFVNGIDGWRPGIPRRFTFSARIGF